VRGEEEREEKRRQQAERQMSEQADVNRRGEGEARGAELHEQQADKADHVPDCDGAMTGRIGQRGQGHGQGHDGHDDVAERARHDERPR
jgi:hypothetical protein